MAYDAHFGSFAQTLAARALVPGRGTPATWLVNRAVPPSKYTPGVDQ